MRPSSACPSCLHRPMSAGPGSTRRQQLVAGLGGSPQGLRDDQRLRDLDRFQARAFDLLTSSSVRAAMHIDREDPRTRDRYGRNIYGQSVLLARRLVEAGVRVASISWAPDANATWDTHANNFPTLKNRLLPQLDAAVSSLLDDLVARGRLERTLVVVMGEFGAARRLTPRAAASTGTMAILSSLPEAASGPATSMAGAIRSGHAPILTPSHRPRSLPRSTTAWGFRQISSCTTNSSAL